jgi:hypothetical protein
MVLLFCHDSPRHVAFPVREDEIVDANIFYVSVLVPVKFIEPHFILFPYDDKTVEEFLKLQVVS